VAISGCLGEKPYWPSGRQIILSIKTEMKADREAKRGQGRCGAPVGNLRSWDDALTTEVANISYLSTFPYGSWLPLINSVHAIIILLNKFSI